METLERTPADDARTRAIERLKKRHELTSHVVVFTMVNGFLIAIWALTGHGFFWPMFPLFGWGIGLVMHAWDFYWRAPSEDQIRREMERFGG